MRTPLPMTQNGHVAYDGPSQLDGEPILLVVSGLRTPSENTKTGPLVQTDVLVKGVSPLQATKDGRDASVCGEFVHRGRGGRAGSCYVNVGQRPEQALKTVTSGGYPPVEPTALARHYPERLWRLGSYGDPVAVPLSVWYDLLADCRGRIGYTHQWRQYYARPYRHLLMASTETVAQTFRAWDEGWRTYRTLSAGEDLLPGEVWCPASAERNFARTCATCMACDGRKDPADRRVSIAARAHGLSWKVKLFESAQEKLLRAEKKTRRPKKTKGD